MAKHFSLFLTIVHLLQKVYTYTIFKYYTDLFNWKNAGKMQRFRPWTLSQQQEIIRKSQLISLEYYYT
jgi:hypothetical protein